MVFKTLIYKRSVPRNTPQRVTRTRPAFSDLSNSRFSKPPLLGCESLIDSRQKFSGGTVLCMDWESRLQRYCLLDNARLLTKLEPHELLAARRHLKPVEHGGGNDNRNPAAAT